MGVILVVSQLGFDWNIHLLLMVSVVGLKIWWQRSMLHYSYHPHHHHHLQHQYYYTFFIWHYYFLKLLHFYDDYVFNPLHFYQIHFTYTIGSIASSAPVIAETNFYGYMDVVAQSLIYFSGQSCYNAFELAANKVSDLLKTTDGC